MNKTKTILSVFIVLLAILAIAFFIGLKNLDSLVKNMIEDTGTAVTKTAVTVDDVQIDITGGRGEIRGIRVKSPEGYATRDALKLDRSGLSANLAAPDSGVYAPFFHGHSKSLDNLQLLLQILVDEKS